MRLAVAEAVATTPDDAWKNTVRGLARDPNPVVRAGAAKLLGRFDPAEAQATLTPMLGDSNPAVRDLIANTLPQVITNDVAGLRRLLRSDRAATRVRAASRLLELTR